MSLNRTELGIAKGGVKTGGDDMYDECRFKLFLMDEEVSKNCDGTL